MPTVEELQDRVMQLEEILGLHDEPPPIGIPPTPAKVLGLLMRRSFISAETACDCLYGDRPEVASDQAIRAHIKRLREILVPHGIEIKNKHGEGYYIEPKDKQKLLDRWPQLKRAA